MGKVVFVPMQDPRGHGDSEAGGDGVALERGAAFRDYAWEAGNDAEGEAEGFVYDARQIWQAFQDGEFHLGAWIWKCSLQFCRELCVDPGILDHLVYACRQPIARCICCCCQDAVGFVFDLIWSRRDPAFFGVWRQQFVEDCFAGVFADPAGVEIGFGDEDLLFSVLQSPSANGTLGAIREEGGLGGKTYFLQAQDVRKRRAHFFQHPLRKTAHDAQLRPLLENPQRGANASNQLEEIGA